MSDRRRPMTDAELARARRADKGAAYTTGARSDRIGIQPPKPVTLPKLKFLEPRDGE